MVQPAQWLIRLWLCGDDGDVNADGKAIVNTATDQNYKAVDEKLQLL